MNSIVHMLNKKNKKKKNCKQSKLLILKSALNPKKNSQVICGVLRNYLYKPNQPRTHHLFDSIHVRAIHAHFNPIHLGHHSFHP